MRGSSATPGEFPMTDHVATPLSLDVTTLFIVASCIAALLGVFLLFAWTQDCVRALAWWGAAYLIGGFSVALWLTEPATAWFMPASLPSGLIFLACGMVWSAARLFHNRKILWPVMLAGSAVWILACTTTLV